MGPDHTSSVTCDRGLCLGSVASPCCEWRRITAPRQCPSVHTPHETKLVELAKISQDSVGRHAKLGTEVVGENPPALAEQLDDDAVAFGGKHMPNSTCVC
jgi:hypothetical protein